MADNAEVKLGADTSGLKSNMADGASAVRKSLNDVATYLKDVAAAGNSTEKELKQVLDSLKRGFADTAESAHGSTEKITAGVTAMRLGVAAALGAIAIGLKMAFGGIRELTEEAESVRSLQDVFGMASGEASRMNIALQLVGKTSQEYAGIALNLARQIKTDEERMNALGVVTRDAATGAFLPMNEVMKNAFATMQTYKSGLDQNEFALEAFGRSAKDVFAYLQLGEPIMERAAQLQRELGIEMDADKQAKVKAYQTEIRALGVVFTEIEERLGEALMPLLKMFASWLATSGISALKSFADSLVTFANEWTLLATHVEAAALKISNWFSNLVVRSQQTALVIKAGLAGNWDEIPRIIEAANQRIARNTLATANQVVKIWDEAVAKINSRNASGGGGLANTPPANSGTRSWIPKEKAAGKETTRIAEWEAMLKAERDGYERMKLDQGSFERWSEAQTSEFWERIKATYTLNSKELIAVDSRWYDSQRKVRQGAFDDLIASLEREKQAIRFDYDERVRLAAEQARLIAQAYGASSKEAMAAEARLTREVESQTNQRIALIEVEAKRRQAVAEHFVTMGQLQVQQDVALRRISAEEAFRLEAQLQSRLFEIRQRALREQLALERDPVKIAEINARIEQLELEHQTRMTEIANRAELERKQYAIAAAQAFQDNFANLIDGLISGTKNWKDVFKDAIKSLTSDLNRLASQAIAKQLFGPGTTGGGFLGGIFGKIFGGGAVGGEDAAVTAAKTAEATASTTVTTALVAMTTAATSAAAALVAVASSSAAKGAGDIFGSIFGGPAFGSYAVGTPYVPQDSLAMVHRGEAIIPAKYNRAGGGTNVGGISQQFVISGPVDTRTQYQISEAAARGARIAMMRAGSGG